MVAEFDEYTNDWLYLREGTFFPRYTFFQSVSSPIYHLFIPLTSALNLLAARPQYRKKMASQSSEFSNRGNSVAGSKLNTTTMEPPAMFMPNLAPSRSVRETIQEVKMVQVCSNSLSSKLV